VPEMLRIMDVATTLRLDRELVEEQLNFEDLKARLKERMLAASKVTGESVTPEEVDAAIDRYYANLYTFHEPKMSFAVAMAHAWVRRGPILGWGFVLTLAALVWVIFFTPPVSNRAHIAAQLDRYINERAHIIRSIARDPRVAPEVDRLTAEAFASRKVWDATRLKTLRQEVDDLEAKLTEEYDIISVPLETRNGKNQNTIVRYPPDNDGKKIKAYYLFVQARKPDGSALPRRIRSSETAVEKVVTTWGEQIPEAVYERLKKDKLDDGILNETAFAVKRMRVLDEEVTMPGLDGKPLARMGRITEW
jgi:hypothetical protein